MALCILFTQILPNELLIYFHHQENSPDFNFDSSKQNPSPQLKTIFAYVYMQSATKKKKEDAISTLSPYASLYYKGQKQ